MNFSSERALSVCSKPKAKAAGLFGGDEDEDEDLFSITTQPKAKASVIARSELS